MVVDDAVVVRGLLSRWIDEHPGLRVVATASNGRLALDELDSLRPDVIILDLDMPEMDGLTALPLILRKSPSSSVIIASTLTRRNAELALKCITLGAIDCVTKPETNREVTTSLSFRRELLQRIEAIAAARHRRARLHDVETAIPSPPSPGSPGPDMPVPPLPARAAPHCRAPAMHPLERLRQERDSRPLPAGTESGSRATGAILRTRDVESRPVPPAQAQTGLRTGPVGMLCIGASTGGPKAVSAFLSGLGQALDHVPTLIVQHMPPIFTTVFADHLRAATGRTAREPMDGERLENGVIYVAPGGRHLRILRRGGHATAQLDDGPPVNFCRPAVDHLFADAARSFGAQTLAIVLTGMGHDGLEGARALKVAGAQVLVQDEASSAVWGMPGSIARAGLADAILDVAGLAAQSRRTIGEGRR